MSEFPLGDRLLRMMRRLGTSTCDACLAPQVGVNNAQRVRGELTNDLKQNVLRARGRCQSCGAETYVTTVGPGDPFYAELRRRDSVWAALISAGGPQNLKPAVIRELKAFGGYQGVWVDAKTTMKADGQPVTVGILHTGIHYPDDLSEDALLYHYPDTGRPDKRDEAEVQATKRAALFGLPIFVITHSENGRSRNVRRAWVDAWDNDQKCFAISFKAEPIVPLSESTTEDDERSFALAPGPIRPVSGEREMRVGQPVFRFSVFRRYGVRCAVCPIQQIEMIQAAHLVGWKAGGNDPRNGLPLCANHHRAFDAGLFAIEPSTKGIHVRAKGPDRRALQITESTIEHLPRFPHVLALTQRWEEWCQSDAQ